MRERYSAFLSDSYSENDTYVQSSDVDRTIMSAEAFLAGLYKTEKPTDIWKANLPWQPVPVHTTPPQYDHIVIADRKCAAFDESLDDFLQSDKIKEFNQKHKDLYEYLELHSGDTVEKMTDTVPIQDTLKIEKIHNRT